MPNQREPFFKPYAVMGIIELVKRPTTHLVVRCERVDEIEQKIIVSTPDSQRHLTIAVYDDEIRFERLNEASQFKARHSFALKDIYEAGVFATDWLEGK